MGSTKLISGLTLNMLRASASQVAGRPESDLLGFVAYQSNSAGTIKAIRSYNPDEADALLYIANPENYVIAVWKDADAPDITFADATYSEFGMSHTNPTTWVKAEFIEQLYFGDESLDLGYKLAQDIYDEWTVIESGNNTTGYTVKASGSIAEPIVNSTEYIYMSDKTIYKQNNTGFYSNVTGTIGFFNNEARPGYITQDNSNRNILAKDFIYAETIDFVGNLNVMELPYDIEGNSAFINMKDTSGHLYIAGDVLFAANENLRIVGSKSANTYIFDTTFIDNVNSLSTKTNNAMLYFPGAGDRMVGETVIKDTDFDRNTANSIISIGGNYSESLDDGILTLYNVTFDGNFAPKVPSTATDSAIIKVDDSNTNFEQMVNIVNSKFVDNNDTSIDSHQQIYNSIIKSYGHTIYLNGTQIYNNKTSDYILYQTKATGLDKMRYMLMDTIIDGNVLTYSETTKDLKKGIVLYQDYADQGLTGSYARSINMIASTSITMNDANVAVYNSDIKGSGRAMAYAFGGEVFISSNENKDLEEMNLLVKDSQGDEAHTVTFIKTGSDYYDIAGNIASLSYIGVRVDATWAAADISKTIAYNSWLFDERPAGATYQMFESDDDTYIVAKSGSSIVLMKEANTANYITTYFEPYDDTVSPITPQHIMVGVDTVADEPMT
ncbi:MAG: hypothetical protein IJ593_00825, partial [Lachnospiraceae bacterium]|nr:hypothetical protein [Lachnospiraceae bacterium]